MRSTRMVLLIAFVTAADIVAAILVFSFFFVTETEQGYVFDGVLITLTLAFCIALACCIFVPATFCRCRTAPMSPRLVCPIRQTASH